MSLYIPEVSDCPVPLKFIDVNRTTFTDLDVKDEGRIEDVWSGEEGDRRDLSGEWTGKTVFELLKPEPKPGYQWSSGRLTRKQTGTARPLRIWPEVWKAMTQKRRKRVIERERLLVERRDHARSVRGIGSHVPYSQLEEYNSNVQII